MSSHKKKKIRVAEQEEVPIAAMIDVVFLLLTFFIMTSNETIDEAHISITLPAPNPNPPKDVDPPPSVDIFVLSEVKHVNANGNFEYQVQGQSFTPNKLHSYMSKVAADPDQAAEVLVNVKVSLSAKHKRVIELVDILKKHKIEKISILSLKDPI